MKDAMKFDRLLKETIEDIHDDHLSGNINTPLREDAFELSDEEKINKIEQDVTRILETLGMDLTDDSMRGTPKRVAKMFVNELFAGLHPDNKPSASTFDINTNTERCWWKKTSPSTLLASIICSLLLEKRTWPIFQMVLWWACQK